MEAIVQNINVDLIIPNRFQPRLSFDENALNELANSIKEHGIIQPLVVRKLNDKYEIIAGERRYKAAIIAGLTELPVIITNFDDNESAEIALVENIQRKDLNSIEEAKAYKRILSKGYLTQEALATKLGISQSSLANKLRLLNLSFEVQEALMNDKISERHARSLLSVTDTSKQINLLNRIINERLTVKQLDNIIKGENDGTSSGTLYLEKETNSNNLFDVENKGITSNLIESDNIFNLSTNINHEVGRENIEKLDDLISENEESKDSVNIFDIFKQSNIVSLEDEAANLNLDDLNINNDDLLTSDFKDNVTIESDNIVSESIKEGDLSSVKEAYNNLKDKIEKANFKISMEEFDFEDIYQLVIKIDK